jgi:NitT/TauT family transport system substrate-binding protein
VRLRIILSKGIYRVLLGLTATIILFAEPARADDAVRVVAQRTGTFGWELDVIRAHGLDKAAGLAIQVTELASPEAGKIALRGGSADVVVSDWTWVSRERTLGARLVFHPYSSAVGAVMVAPTSAIKNLSDLRGRKLAVAGGPLDKSWLFLQGALMQDGVDLRTQANIVYGTPALLAEKTLQGEMDATLNYWNICAGLEVRGLRRLAEISDLFPRFGVAGRPALIGYVFNEQWAVRHRDALARFLDVTAKAKDILANSDAEWERIAPLVGIRDMAALKVYRDRYRDGIPHRTIAQEEADARTLYRVLAKLGGTALVGEASELEPGTFYRPH